MADIKSFYEQEYDILVKKLVNRAGGRENAEDVVMESFARALQYFKSYDPNRKEFGAWFNTILNNTLRDFKRVERNYGMNLEADESILEAYNLDSDAKETVSEIKKRIRRKPQHTREILKLYYLHQYTPKDIENVTEHPRGTILSTITRFKNEIKEWYDKSMCG